MAFLDENGLALLWGQIINKINDSIADLEGGSGGGGASTDITLPVSIENGGTGAQTAAVARANLGITLANLGAAAEEHVHDTSDITSGTLPTTRGGTGLTASPSLQVNLASTSAASIFAASPRPGVTGTLATGNGGTGRTDGAAPKVLVGSTVYTMRTGTEGAAGYITFVT